MTSQKDREPFGEELVSESVTPDAGTFDPSAMARGEPGIPAGFTWRGRHYGIAEVLDVWKESEAWDHAGGERYYRKRFFRIRTESGEEMTLYALRKVKAGESDRKRWWLYTVARSEPGDSRRPDPAVE